MGVGTELRRAARTGALGQRGRAARFEARKPGADRIADRIAARSLGRGQLLQTQAPVVTQHGLRAFALAWMRRVRRVLFESLHSGRRKNCGS